jgi:glycosyltransferase involved in cell wall biosynthesis
MPKVSVIIPTHNRAEVLRSAIASVLKQTYQDFEVIVVDDASDDAPREVLTYFNDKRIKYVRHEVNKGDAGSRNTGILNSGGDYLAFLDDDDEWLPEKLQMQVDVLTNSASDIGGVYTGMLIIDRTGKISGTHIPVQGVKSPADLSAENVIATSSIMLRRECFQKVGLFDEKIPYTNDYDMWIRISAEFKLECIKKPLVKYSAAGGNKLSTDYDKVIKGQEILIDKYDQLFARNRKNCSRYYLSLGILYCYNKHPAKGRRAFLKAIQLYPFEIRHYFNLGLSLLGVNNFKKLKKLKETLSCSRS